MKVITSIESKPKRTVREMHEGEAFSLNGIWYTIISLDDGMIRNFSDFWEMHAETVPGYPPPRKEYDAIPCFRIPSSSFVYIDPDLEVEEYGVPTVTVALS